MDEPSNARGNLNTILLTIALGALSWIGYISWDNSIKVSAILAAQIGRPEFEAKLAEVKGEQARQATAIVQLQIDMSKLQMGIRR